MSTPIKPAIPQPPAHFTAEEVAEIVARTRCEERARIFALLSSSECEGRDALVAHLCFKSSMPWKTAIDVLKHANRGDSPPTDFETEEQRQAITIRVGELVGRKHLALELIHKTDASSFFCAGVLASETE